MVKRKLAVAVFLIITAFCCVTGFAACEEQHVHTFSEDWMRSETEHWHEATCDHTDEKGDLGTHVDSDNNGKCDVCDYTMQTTGEHQHTFAKTWSYDGKTHWHAATCDDTTEKRDEAPHVDEDGDQFCDICTGLITHEHTFSETEWIYDIEKHWRPATCIHDDEKGSEAEHTFTAGVCECGLKEVEKQAYNALIEHEKLDGEETDIYTWLTGLKTAGKAVRITAQGDIVYDHNGEVEGVYVAQRTIKVQAITKTGDEEKALPEVWFKITYDNDKYISEKGTNALAVGETDEEGFATLTFNPIGGYASYKVALAEAKDVVALTDNKDETKIKVTPNRYSVKTSTDGKGGVCDFEVTENTEAVTTEGKLEFKYDVSWAASEKTTLAYSRYPANAVAGTDIKEEGQTTTLKTSGDGLFDYILFIPSQKYSWAQGGNVEEFDKIIENFQKAASGVYEISFTAEGDDSARLYYWDGIDLSTGQKETDGSPSNMYVKSVSGTKPQEGSTIDENAFTNTNNVKITIESSQGLEHFQLGIKCNTSCTVEITVERSEYIPPEPGKLKVGSNTTTTDSRPGYKISSLATTNFSLAADSNITDGWYTLEVIPHDEYCIMSRTIVAGSGDYWIGASLYTPGVLQCSVNGKSTLLWQACKDGKPASYEGRSYTIYDKTGKDTGRKKSISDFNNVSLKGVVYLTSTSVISIRCRVNVTYYADIDIEPCNEEYVQTLEGKSATIEKDIAAFVPATKKSDDNSFEFSFGNSINENTVYRIRVTIPRPYVLEYDANAGATYAYLTLGGVESKIDGRRGALLQENYTYELVTIIKKGDKLKITSGMAEVNIFMAEVTVSTYDTVELGVPVPYTQRYMQVPQRRLNFTAEEAGTYRVTLTRTGVYEHDSTDFPEDFTDGDVDTFDVIDLLHNKLIIEHTREQRRVSAPIQNPVLTVSGEFEMQAGESIMLEIKNKCVFEALDFTLTITKV